VLARANLGPLLLVPASGLTPSQKAEVARMTPVGALLLGNLFGPRVQSDLVAAGVPSDQIRQIPGTSPAEIAANIATHECPEPLRGNPFPVGPSCLDRRTPAQKAAGVPAFDAVIIANFQSPDAYSTAALAAHRRLPVLYVDRTGIPPATADALNRLNVNQTLVVGSATWVPESVVSQLASAGRNPKRLAGADVYGTSAAVLQESIARGMPTNQVFVSEANNPMISAIMGSAAGRIGGLQLLVRSTADAQNAVANLGLAPGLDRIWVPFFR
jgi:putative cell wall-binding protein